MLSLQWETLDFRYQLSLYLFLALFPVRSKNGSSGRCERNWIRGLLQSGRSCSGRLPLHQRVHPCGMKNRRLFSKVRIFRVWILQCAFQYSSISTGEGGSLEVEALDQESIRIWSIAVPSWWSQLTIDWDRSVVLRSFSWISAIWGFFTSREDTIPGNFAISDMIESLNWAKRYISFFGGDPSRITICGN